MSWKYNNKILHPYCFQTEWISSDNLHRILSKHYTGIKENYYNTKEFDDFRVNLGSYWGKEITSFDPIRASWDEDVELAVSIDSCLGKKSKNFSIRNDRVSSSLLKRGMSMDIKLLKKYLLNIVKLSLQILRADALKATY